MLVLIPILSVLRHVRRRLRRRWLSPALPPGRSFHCDHRKRRRVGQNEEDDSNSSRLWRYFLVVVAPYSTWARVCINSCARTYYRRVTSYIRCGHVRTLVQSSRVRAEYSLVPQSLTHPPRGCVASVPRSPGSLFSRAPQWLTPPHTGRGEGGVCACSHVCVCVCACMVVVGGIAKMTCACKGLFDFLAGRRGWARMAKRACHTLLCTNHVSIRVFTH